MAKNLTFQRRGFGGEPDTPNEENISRFIKLNREYESDLTSLRIFQSIEPQVVEKLEYPCAGGVFYQERLREGIVGVHENIVIEELDYYKSPFIADAALVRSISQWASFSLPAPHVLDFTNEYYKDRDEFLEDICTSYRGIFRTMRDTGLKGHIIHAKLIDETEIDQLSSKDVLFIVKSQSPEDIQILLEYQKNIGVFCETLNDILPVLEETNIQKLILIDPVLDSIKEALQWFEPEKIEVGGYCIADSSVYWKDLISSISIP